MGFRRVFRNLLPPPVLVGGLGRCGTTLVNNAIISSNPLAMRENRFVVDIADWRFQPGLVYKTHDYPPDTLQADAKVLFLYGNPMDAAISGYRNFTGKRHYRHVKSPHADLHERMFEQDILLMEAHFDRWMRPQNFSFLSLRYEHLFHDDVQDAIRQYLGMRFGLPRPKTRVANWQDHPARETLEATYGRLAQKVEDAGSFTYWPASAT